MVLVSVNCSLDFRLSFVVSRTVTTKLNRISYINHASVKVQSDTSKLMLIAKAQGIHREPAYD